MYDRHWTKCYKAKFTFKSKLKELLDDYKHIENTSVFLRPSEKSNFYNITFVPDMKIGLRLKIKSCVKTHIQQVWR